MKKLTKIEGTILSKVFHLELPFDDGMIKNMQVYIKVIRMSKEEENNRISKLIDEKDWHELFSTEEIVTWKKEDSTKAIKKVIKRELFTKLQKGVKK